MRRRDFITVFGFVLAWPLPTRSQQSAIPVVGFLNGASSAEFQHQVAAFRRGLEEGGFVEGTNVVIEYQWAEGQYDRLRAMAADMAHRQVAAIVATGGSVGAAKAATSKIPIIFTMGSDPVKDGLVSNLNRPGGNLTGLTMLNQSLDAKRLELLHELLPNVGVLGVLMNPTWRASDTQLKDVKEAATRAAVSLVIAEAGADGDFDPAFASLIEKRVKALAVASDPFFNSRRKQLVALAARYRIPAIYEWREFVEAGGLMSYGTNLDNEYRQVGIYTARILKGEKPADLPVQQPTKFDLVINLKTAKALGIEVPGSLLARADEVIE
jgi:ABC-type uncharacterized transport system substrate-binding protein